MSDFEIDYDWLAARLAERGVKKECPTCGAGRWVGMGDNRKDRTRLPVFDEAGNESGRSTDMFTLTCLNCGFTRLHAIAPLLGSVGTWPGRDDFNT